MTVMGTEEKNPKEKVKKKKKIEQNKTSFGFPPIPSSIKGRSTVFRSPRGRETKLKGKINVRYGAVWVVYARMRI